MLPIAVTIGPKDGFPGQFTFDDGSSKERPVSFQRGIYMTGGQDKGLWLRRLLARINQDVSHIVFVDDETKNLHAIERAFIGKVSTTLCRYGYVDDRVEAFNKSKKKSEIELWRRLKDVLVLFD